MQQTFNVPEVSCAHCKTSIEGALKPLDGVSDAAVDIEGKVVTIDFDDSVVARDKLVQAIHEAGYEVAS
jgi:copper chaperone